MLDSTDLSGSRTKPNIGDPLDFTVALPTVAFFCLAKSKIDDSKSSFWLILLGTDRLETSFGLLRTMVGTDSNVDCLQLSSRLSGVALAANILAEHPEWGGVSRRLKLPSMDTGDGNVSPKLDHITPNSWKGNVCVEAVVPHTCWQLGRQMAIRSLGSYPTERILGELESTAGIDMLCPFGELLVKAPSPEILENPTLADPEEFDFIGVTTENNPSSSDESQLDIEDEAHAFDNTSHAVLHDPVIPCPSPPYIEYGGMKLHKARILRNSTLYTTSVDSTDRLARVSGRSRYAVSPGDGSRLHPDLIQDGSLLGGAYILPNDPAATLVRCEHHTFLAIVQVNSLLL